MGPQGSYALAAGFNSRQYGEQRPIATVRSWPEVMFERSLSAHAPAPSSTSQPPVDDEPVVRPCTGPGLQSAIVVLVLVPRRQQHDIELANGEEHDTPAMTEWDDELAELPVLLRSTTSVRRERQDRHRALDGVAESKQARVVRRVACQLPLDDVLLQALNVFLERDASDNPIPGAHPPDRLFLAATAARMRFCAP